MTFTKERLEQFINKPLEYGLTRGEQMEMARIALASLEAEPVAFVMADDLKDSSIISTPAYCQLDEARERTVGDVVALYTAQPAPVVPAGYRLQPISEYDAMCAAMLQGAEPTKAGLTLREGLAVIRNSGIAIDAEKIQAERDALNSPAIPDGWVACSERMPPAGGSEQSYVLAADFKNHYWPNLPNTQVGVYGDWFSDGNPTWDDGDGNDLHLKEVTHWMPLPAAPQQEAKA